MSDQIKSMINALINDNKETAQLDLHSYLTNLVKDKVGLSEAARRVPAGTFGKQWWTY